MARTYYRQARTGFPAYVLSHPLAGGWGWVRACGCLLQQGPDELGEAVPGPIEAALHGAQVAARNVGDFGVALAFQLAEHEDGPMVGGQLVHAPSGRLRAPRAG